MAQRLTEQELLEMLHEVRDKDYPDLDLTNVKMEISNRMTVSAGKVKRWQTLPHRFLMIISGPYHDRFGWGVEVFQTIKHGIIHIARPYGSHGAGFYNEMHRTGAERFCRTQGRDLVRKGQYRCKACGHIFKSADRAQFCPLCDDFVEQIGTVEE